MGSQSLSKWQLLWSCARSFTRLEWWGWGGGWGSSTLSSRIQRGCPRDHNLGLTFHLPTWHFGTKGCRHCPCLYPLHLPLTTDFYQLPVITMSFGNHPRRLLRPLQKRNEHIHSLHFYAVSPKGGKACVFFLIAHKWMISPGETNENKIKPTLPSKQVHTSAWHQIPSSLFFFPDLHFLLFAFSPWLSLCPSPSSSLSLSFFWLSWLYFLRPQAQRSLEGQIQNSGLLDQSESSYQTDRLYRERKKINTYGQGHLLLVYQEKLKCKTQKNE